MMSFLKIKMSPSGEILVYILTMTFLGTREMHCHEPQTRLAQRNRFAFYYQEGQTACGE